MSYSFINLICIRFLNIINKIIITKLIFYQQFLYLNQHNQPPFTFILSMYTFPQQEKIFKDLLATTSSNKECADCSTVGPTWASLNFGVFLCSNCSGAHRALGPTITRVKSTKLDQWQRDWMENMQIGNKQLNNYWESQLGMNKKPRMGATQPEILKYVTEKYVKKRFVKSLSEDDPLTKYKNGAYKRKQQTRSQQNKQNKKTVEAPKIQKSIATESNRAVQNQSNNLNLIQFQFPEEAKHEVKSQSSEAKNGKTNHNNANHMHSNQKAKEKTQYSASHGNQDDEFSQYTEHGTSFTGTTTEKIVTYEQLFSKKSKQSDDGHFQLPPSLHHTQSANSIPHSHFNPQINVNMNGHLHQVGGHQIGYPSTNYNIPYNQSNQYFQYQSVSSIGGVQPVQSGYYQQQSQTSGNQYMLSQGVNIQTNQYPFNNSNPNQAGYSALGNHITHLNSQYSNLGAYNSPGVSFNNNINGSLSLNNNSQSISFQAAQHGDNKTEKSGNNWIDDWK